MTERSRPAWMAGARPAMTAEAGLSTVNAIRASNCFPKSRTCDIYCPTRRKTQAQADVPAGEMDRLPETLRKPGDTDQDFLFELVVTL
jgi:hypothetical protein